MSGDGELVGAVVIASALSVKGAGDPDGVLALAGRLLEAVTVDGSMPAEELRVARAVVLGRLWQGLGTDAAGPDRYVARGWWLERFLELGWVHPWVRGPRPGSVFGVVRLYRGALAERRDGLAWTSSRALAAWFAERAGAGGRVWRADVPVDRLVCAFPIRVAGCEASTEYVVDAAGLVVVEDVA